MKLLTLLTLSLFITIGLRAQTTGTIRHDSLNKYYLAEPYGKTIWPPQIEPYKPEPKAKVKLLYVPIDIYKATEKINEYCARDSVSVISVDLNREPGSKFRTAIITYKKVTPIKITK